MNKFSKELIHMTDAEKRAYNKSYYEQHKDYWKNYYSKGNTVGRPSARQKNVTSGNSKGITVRKNDKALYGDAYNASMANWSNLVSQTGSSSDSHNYNNALFGESGKPTLSSRPRGREKKVTEGIGVGKVRKDQTVSGPVAPKKQINYGTAIGPVNQNSSQAVGKKRAKKLLESFGSNWKSGASSIKSAGKNFIDNWKSGAKTLKNLKLVEKETTYGVVPQVYGAPIYTETITRKKKKR